MALDTSGNLKIDVQVDPSMEIIDGVAHVKLSQHPGNLLYFLDDGRLSLREVEEEEIVVDIVVNKGTKTVTSKKATTTNKKTNTTSERKTYDVVTTGDDGQTITSIYEEGTDWLLVTHYSGYVRDDGYIVPSYTKKNHCGAPIVIRQTTDDSDDTPRIVFGNSWSGDDWDLLPSQSSKYTSSKVALPYRPMNGIAGSAHQPIKMIRCNSSVSRLATIPSSGVGNVSKSTDGVNTLNLVAAILNRVDGTTTLGISQANAEPESKPYWPTLFIAGIGISAPDNQGLGVD